MKAEDVVLRLLLGGCRLCGDGMNTRLHFHHIDPKTRSFSVNLANAFYNPRSRDKALEEIAKCIVLCPKCHKMVHKRTLHTIPEKVDMRLLLDLRMVIHGGLEEDEWNP